jgi:hypothetical protein
MGQKMAAEVTLYEGHGRFFGTLPTVKPLPIPAIMPFRFTDKHLWLWTGRPKKLVPYGHVPMSTVDWVVVDQFQAQHAVGWTPALGFLGAGRQVSATSAVRVRFKDVNEIVLEVGGPPAAVAAAASRLLDRFPYLPPAVVPAAAPAAPPAPADELERLAALVERGFLTREEFDARKAALLEGRP